MQQDTTQSETIRCLNEFLRGEISAVETYRQALALQNLSSDARSTMERCATSHQQRVDLLRNGIRRLGGVPVSDSGPWGSFAKLVEGGATALGVKPAIVALEEGEDHGVKLYAKQRTNLPSSAMAILEQQLVPEQNRTHTAMSSLKTRF